MDCSLPGPSIHGIFQARVLEWGAIAFFDKDSQCWITYDSYVLLYVPGGASGEEATCQCRKVKSESEVAQSCPTLSDTMDCSPPGSSVHGIAIAFSITLH